MDKGNLFNSVRVEAPTHNWFDLTHDHKLSCNMGKLYPILALDCVPSDKINLSAEAMVRLMPMVTPPMHRVDTTMHFFFVPHRIIWERWNSFITQTEVGGAVPTHPFINLTQVNYVLYPLMDYMGLPDPGAANTYQVSALPFAAYQSIYNTYYRDQNLVTTGIWDNEAGLSDGDNSGDISELCQIRTRAWEHDYFTAALPFAQKGAEVAIPLGSISLDPTWSSSTSTPKFMDDGGNFVDGQMSQATLPVDHIAAASSSGETLAYDPDGTLITQPTTIADLRRANALQKLLETMARAGTRIKEYLKAMFNVNSSDARLSQPEYINGSKSPIVISEVLNTSDTANAPQGNMAGHGIGFNNGEDKTFFCEEYGYVIGILSILPKTGYFQGIPRHFSKFDNLDYFNPYLQHIGEQEVLLKELFAAALDGNATFGYNPRYSEYKYMMNRVSGQFKTTLDNWHMARKFASEPALNQQFIEADPTHRIFAVETEEEDKCLVYILFKIKANRPMAKYGNPATF